MLKKLPKLALAALLLVLSTNNAFAKATPETVVEVLKLSGVTELIGAYPKQFKASLDQTFENDQQVSQDIKDAFYNATKNTIKPSTILLETSKSILGVMEESELQEILAWYQSDLGKRVAQEEKLASTPEAAEIVARDQKVLLDQFQRAGFASNIEKLSNATDFAIQFRTEMTMASRTAAAASQSIGDVINPEQFRDPVSANMLRDRSALKERIVASYIYSHRNIGLRDLIKYEMFLSTDATVKFNRLLLKALGDSFRGALKNWGDELQVSLDEIPS